MKKIKSYLTNLFLAIFPFLKKKVIALPHLEGISKSKKILKVIYFDIEIKSCLWQDFFIFIL